MDGKAMDGTFALRETGGLETDWGGGGGMRGEWATKDWRGPAADETRRDDPKRPNVPCLPSPTGSTLVVVVRVLSNWSTPYGVLLVVVVWSSGASWSLSGLCCLGTDYFARLPQPKPVAAERSVHALARDLLYAVDPNPAIGDW